MAHSNKNSFFVLAVTVITVLVLFNLYMFKDDIFYPPKHDLEEVDVKDFSGIENLILTGEVYEVLDKIGNYHGMGIVRLNVVNSNIKNYDPRDFQANYYCIIKQGKAELYVKGVSDIKPNDTVYINISEKKSFVFNSRRNYRRPLSFIVYPRRFFDLIRRKGYQKI